MYESKYLLAFNLTTMTTGEFNKLSYSEQDKLIDEKGTPLPTFTDEHYIIDLWEIENFFVQHKTVRNHDLAEFHALETEEDFEPFKEFLESYSS